MKALSSSRPSQSLGSVSGSILITSARKPVSTNSCNKRSAFSCVVHKGYTASRSTSFATSSPTRGDLLDKYHQKQHRQAHSDVLIPEGCERSLHDNLQNLFQ